MSPYIGFKQLRLYTVYSRTSIPRAQSKGLSYRFWLSVIQATEVRKLGENSTTNVIRNNVFGGIQKSEYPYNVVFCIVYVQCLSMTVVCCLFYLC